MSKIWTLILLSSIITLLFVNPSVVVTAMISGSADSLKLALDLIALYGFWLGLFGIIEKIGIADKLAKALNPLVKFLFPNANDDTKKFITLNMSANMLGLGNASTPMGISAVNSMDKGQNKASVNMVMLVVVSCTSLQLLPSTVIGLRSTYGSTNPTDFLFASTVATITSTVLGIAMVKIYAKIKMLIQNKKSVTTVNADTKTIGERV